MDEKTLKNLEALEQVFQHACAVCDPLDYNIRQRNLLYTLCNIMIFPLAEYRIEQANLNKQPEEKFVSVEATPVTSEACEGQSCSQV